MNPRLYLASLGLIASIPLIGFGASSNVGEACSKLTNQSRELTANCVAHVELFELKTDFIRASTEFSEDVDTRMKVLKSGADIHILKLCKSLNWNLDNTLSCLRSYPTPELLKACKKFSKNEEDQLRCLRMGREAAQVDACEEIGKGMESRFECLEMNIPAYEARACWQKEIRLRHRFLCLQKVVDARERDFKDFQKEVKRHVAEEERLEALEKKGRMPASNATPTNR